MINKLVVAYDASPHSEKAFDFALELGSKHSAQVLVVSVVARVGTALRFLDASYDVLKSATEYYQTRFKILEERAASVEVKPRFEVREGHPADQIVHFATDEKADMIVMGHRGETLAREWLLGSVAKRVMAYARCSVVIVR